MTDTPIVAGAGDQRRADHNRIATGAAVYCPVCRRPSRVDVLDPCGIARLVSHLQLDHDPYYLARLVIALDARRQELGPPAGDPFYPVDDQA